MFTEEIGRSKASFLNEEQVGEIKKKYLRFNTDIIDQCYYSSLVLFRFCARCFGPQFLSGFPGKRLTLKKASFL